MKKNIQNKIYQGINIKSILFLAIILLAFIVVLISYTSQNFVSKIEKEIKLELKQKVDMAYNVIYPTINSYKKGEITKKEAEEKIKDIVSNMIYGDTNSENYIFMSSYEGYYLVQPFEKEKEGVNMWDYQDSKGNYVIRELVKAAQEKPYGSYVKYFYNLPGTEKISEKLSYVRGIPEIQAYIGTGAYLDLKKEELFLLLNKQKNIMIAFTLGIVFLMMLYVSKYKILNNLLVGEIEKRKIIEKELLEEKEREIIQKKRLETLFNNSQDAIVEFDREGRILNINKSFEKVFGYSIKEIVGKDIDEIIVLKKEYKEAKKLTDKTLKEGVIYTEGIRYKKDKTSVDVLIRSVSIQKEGEVVGGYGIYTDITQIKNYEKKLEYLSEDIA
ncbi:PAS domain S-box-containing protein [Geosporobacter subterraneus DSM 17957]|uniref:PAS domain S-box-containing protein n=1 Tax=Geosporobacter subterraneus DSM 17957 TaxID=1121919 RepID=A0A1M6QMV7_9FIRM|nr:cache domain-containing protein [Geosporobacter subterraneus]SHK21505.1 PAS domain S-box-containing protein [Geosporobacter subterraneus DSM 17957]